MSADGHIDISWEIVDETLYNFDSTSSGLAQSPILGPDLSSQASSPTTTSTPSTPVTSIVAIPTKTTGTFTQYFDATWQCNGKVLEQCYNEVWNPRTTCNCRCDLPGRFEPLLCLPIISLDDSCKEKGSTSNLQKMGWFRLTVG
jgi:hypothetical protein